MIFVSDFCTTDSDGVLLSLEWGYKVGRLVIINHCWI